MLSPYRFAKNIWQLLPVGFADRVRHLPVFGAVVRQISTLLIKDAKHDEIYDARYYDFVDRTSAAAAPAMVDSLLKMFAPNSLVDVGCGTGALLAEVQRRGVAVHGLEYSNAGIARTRGKQVSVSQFDLTSSTSPKLPRPTFDLVTSFEVAEHLDAALADNYVKLLASLGNRIVITAAIPGQGGMNHVNEQPNSYWIRKMEACGARHVTAHTERLRAEWRTRLVHYWFAENVMVFERMR